jgi:hypothetical protein
MCGQKLQRKINNIVDSITIVKTISETKYLVLACLWDYPIGTGTQDLPHSRRALQIDMINLQT